MKSFTPKITAEHAQSEHSEASSKQRREALYLCLASIPAGQVVSYGQLAEMSGVPRGPEMKVHEEGCLPLFSYCP